MQGLPKILILYVDRYIVVINKPHGLRSVPGNKPAVRPRALTVSRIATATKTTDRGTAATKKSPAPAPATTTTKTAAASSTTGTNHSPPPTQRSEATATNGTTKKRPREQSKDGDDGSIHIRDSEDPPPPPPPKAAAAEAAETAEAETAASIPGSSGERRLTAQQAWVAAIESFREDGGGTATSNVEVKVNAKTKARRWVSSIADSHPNQLPSVPRKIQPFIRYCRRNRYKWRRRKQQQSQRLHEPCKWSQNPDDDDDQESTAEDETTAREVHSILTTKQHELMDLPVQTSPEESAYGQVQQYLSRSRRTAESAAGAAPPPPPPASQPPHSSSTLYVVHRLDCETSGVMVFARTQQAASQLGRYWRNEVVTPRKRGGDLGPDVLPVNERAVQKTYIAAVESWPPLTDGETSGVIDVPLSPHPTEKLKWTVDFDNGKPSRTLWQLADNTIGGMSPNTHQLELQPVSGRTHQLRIHCAYMNGTGIVGDSLYGVGSNGPSSPSPSEDKSTPLRLYLHARKLSFPHPSTGDCLEFTCDPNVW